MSQPPVDFVGKSSLKALCDVRVGAPRRKSKKGKGRPDFSERPLLLPATTYSDALTNYLTLTAVPVALFSLLIKDMPCTAMTCPTASGVGCTRMIKLELVLAPVGVICMTPLPLLCVV